MKVPNEVIPERVVKVKENCVNTGNIFHKIKKSMWIGILQQRNSKERACRLNAIGARQIQIPCYFNFVGSP